MRCLVIDQDRIGLDLVLRASASGHDVRWYRFAKFPVRDGEGMTGFTVVDDWRESMKWVGTDGLVVTTHNGRFLYELDRYREFGFKIFAPTVNSAALEISRQTGMEAMQAAGIEVPPYETFDGFAEAEKFARKSDQLWVFKPMGDETDKALTYVPSTPEDLVGWLKRQMANGKTLKGPCILQEKIDMLAEIGVSGWVGPEGFLPDRWQICFEHKKLLNEELGPQTGEMGCYDEQTEVLTRGGWKFWHEVTLNDEIASLQNDEAVFSRPSDLVSYDYVGPMVCWENQTIDICVTPNHNMYVNGQSYARRGEDLYHFVQASECTQAQYAIKRTAKWTGRQSDIYEVPGYTHGKGRGYITVKPRQIPMIEWARFLGFYMAEGCSHRRVALAQSHPRKASRAKEIVDATGYFSVRSKNAIFIHNVQLARHLKPLGLSWQKRVPQYIKDAHPAVIEAFLDGYALGDGNHQPNGFRVFYTSNPGLADDTQELLLKIGRVGIIKNRGIRLAQKKLADGRQIIARRDAYEIIERVKKTRSWLDVRDRSLRMYSGKVYCATVPGHVIFVRRNGKPVWCGNSVCQYAESDKLADELLKPMEPIVRALGHRGDFAVGAMIDKRGNAWPLEFTARCGWPAFFIQMASHRGDPIKWMYDLLDGKDSLRVSYDVAVGVVMAQPPFPYNTGPVVEAVGNPITGIDEIGDAAHLVSVMKGRGPVMGDGKVVQGETYQTTDSYVMCVTGLGKTVEKARAKVYGAVDEVRFPDRIYRTDIGLKVIKALGSLHRYGYAEAMN
jgi:phosphoribosylamine-glycine ligase